MPQPSISHSEIAALLRMVRGVAGVDVLLRKEGGIKSIEIAVQPGQSTRTVVRDVESALYTGLGVVIDHRTISVVGNGGGEYVTEGVARTLQFDSSGGILGEIDGIFSRIQLARVRCEADGELFCRVTVELTEEGENYVGSVRDADTPKARVIAAGRATIQALTECLEDEIAFSLEGIEEFAICDQRAMIAAIRTRRGRQLQSFFGTSLVDGCCEESAAKAVLDALNRSWQVESHSNHERKGGAGPTRRY